MRWVWFLAVCGCVVVPGTSTDKTIPSTDDTSITVPTGTEPTDTATDPTGTATSDRTGATYAVAWDGSQEWFGTFDPPTGVFDPLAVVPGVTIVSDAFAGPSTYFLWANNGLNAIEVSTGAVLYVTAVPVWPTYVAYDALTSTYVAIWWDGSQEQFGTFDPTTGALSATASLPYVTVCGPDQPMFDPIARTITICAYDGTVPVYASIALDTGAVAAEIPIVAHQNGPRWDPVASRFVAHQWNAISRQEEFVSHEPLTGATTVMSVLSGVLIVGRYAEVLDPDRRTYSLWTDLGWMTVDVDTGAVTNLLTNYSPLPGKSLWIED